jgi:hypothetical protein
MSITSDPSLPNIAAKAMPPTEGELFAELFISIHKAHTVLGLVSSLEVVGGPPDDRLRQAVEASIIGADYLAQAEATLTWWRRSRMGEPQSLMYAPSLALAGRLAMVACEGPDVPERVSEAIHELVTNLEAATVSFRHWGEWLVREEGQA